MWPRVVNTLLGLWLMAAPQVLGYAGLAADHDHTLGPIIATLACVAMWGATRPVRWGNLAIGLWMLAAPLLLSFDPVPRWNAWAVALPLVLCASIRGRVRYRFGGGWSMLWRGSGAPAGPAQSPLEQRVNP